MNQQTVERSASRTERANLVVRHSLQSEPSASYRRLKIETNSTGEIDTWIDEESPEIDQRIDYRIRRLVRGFDQSGEYATARVEFTCGRRKEVLYSGGVSLRDMERLYRFLDSWMRLIGATRQYSGENGSRQQAEGSIRRVA